MVDRSPMWFFTNIVKKKSKFNGKFRILDTILGTNEKKHPLLWIYTNKYGFATIKPYSETNADNILSTFLGAVSEKEEIGAHYINEKGFEPMTKKALISKVIDQGIYEDRGIQCLAPSPLYTSKRFVIHFTNNTEKCVIQYKSSNETIEKPLKSSIHCNVMINTLKEVIKTIEKNVGSKEKIFKIFDLSLIFVEDINNTLWLMGASSIKCDHLPAVSQILSPSKTIPDLAYLHLTNSCRSFKSTQDPLFFSTQSIKLSRGQSSKLSCAGNFCKFVLTSNKSSNENQYEQFLEKVIETKRGKNLNELEADKWKLSKKKNENESEKIKLALRADFLLTRRLRKAKNLCLFEIPYKYILMGKKILEYSNFDKQSKDLVEIRIGKIIESIRFTKEMYDKEEMKQIAANSPFHYYDLVKVCNRCYLIYSLFTINFRPMPLPNEKSDGKKKLINKDNLDELLNDIGEYRDELNRHKSLLSMAAGNSLIQLGPKMELSLPSMENEYSTFNPRATISLIKSTDLEYQNLIHECFPDAEKIGETKKTGKESFRGYLKHLERGFRVKTKSGHTNRPILRKKLEL